MDLELLPVGKNILGNQIIVCAKKALHARCVNEMTIYAKFYSLHCVTEIGSLITFVFWFRSCGCTNSDNLNLFMVSAMSCMSLNVLHFAFCPTLCCTFVHFYGHFLQMSHMATESFWGEIANQEFLRIIEHLEVYTYVFKLYSSCSYFQCRFFASECCPKIQNHFTVSFAGDHWT